LPVDTESAALRQLCTEMGPGAKACQLVDLERARPLELEHLSGAIHRLGRGLRVSTPVDTTVYAAPPPFLHGSGADLEAGVAG
jgi:ketopantoate reductase